MARLSEIKPNTGNSFNRTELGNAQLLIQLHGENLRYCPELKRWFVWGENCWKLDSDGQVERFAKTIPKYFYREASLETDEEKRTKLSRWGNSSESQYRIKATVELAKTESGIPVAAGRFDADPNLLGVRNGVVDLKHGNLIVAKRSQLITKQAGVAFSPNAQCPRWIKFVDEITGGDKELASYLQSSVGYFLTGHTSEQCMFIPYGSGANGKTVFLRTIETLLGDYAVGTPPETLMARRNPGGATPELARLRGARLVIASEPNAECELDEAIVKRLTGQDTVVCRQLYSEPFEFLPSFKIVLITNHKPTITGTDNAIWRRIRLIPFVVTIASEKQDRELIGKLQNELPGILNWALVGLRRYNDEGLENPRCVSEATAQYRSAMDVMAEWVEERCIVETVSQTLVKSLYDDYFSWCLLNGHKLSKKKKFGDELENRGFKRGRAATGRFHGGLRLKVTCH